MHQSGLLRQFHRLVQSGRLGRLRLSDLLHRLDRLGPLRPSDLLRLSLLLDPSVQSDQSDHLRVRLLPLGRSGRLAQCCHSHRLHPFLLLRRLLPLGPVVP